jgi:LacI family transcriptional regulator
MAYNDVMAVGAMDAARLHGVRIPEEMCFIGCGNDEQACQMGMPLSSIDIAGQEVGHKAGRLAIRMVASGRKAQTHKVLVTPKLVKRLSSQI